MIEFSLVEMPLFHPQTCIACLSSKGPLVDTLAEQFIAGRDARVYICVQCVKRAARVAGFAKGAKMEELANAAGLLAQKDQELEQAHAAERDLRGKLGQEQRRANQLQATLEETLARERTRQHLAHELGGLAVQLMTVGEPALETVA